MHVCVRVCMCVWAACKITSHGTWFSLSSISKSNPSGIHPVVSNTTVTKQAVTKQAYEAICGPPHRLQLRSSGESRVARSLICLFVCSLAMAARPGPDRQLAVSRRGQSEVRQTDRQTENPYKPPGQPPAPHTFPPPSPRLMQRPSSPSGGF